MKNKLNTMAAFFKALGDPKRLKMIKMLASNMDEILCVSDVAERLGISQPAASQHIKVLKTTGLLNENRRGFRVYYSINAEMLDEYQLTINDLFKKAYEMCPHDYACEKCDYNNGCV